MEPKSIWTIGHSKRAIEVFLDLLTQNGIQLLADVRRFPGSRLHPQFGQDNLTASLSERHIEYRHFPGLGGRRSKRLENSLNTAWEVEAFNAYADHIQSAEFQKEVQALMNLASEKRCAIMCSEAVPWRCHRRIIADYLITRGWLVHDIVDERRVAQHTLPKFAKVLDGQLVYPGNTLF